MEWNIGMIKTPYAMETEERQRPYRLHMRIWYYDNSKAYGNIRLAVIHILTNKQDIQYV